eukprot:1411413-Rhodomonas_salina.1
MLRLRAEAEAVFLPKFENAGEASIKQYHELSEQKRWGALRLITQMHFCEMRVRAQDPNTANTHSHVRSYLGVFVLVAAVKSSGSLFLVSARGSSSPASCFAFAVKCPVLTLLTIPGGVLVTASKNSAGNAYSDCGHYML